MAKLTSKYQVVRTNINSPLQSEYLRKYIKKSLILVILRDKRGSGKAKITKW